jgi:serine/threonine-protein kinase
MQCPRCAHLIPGDRRRCDRCGADWGADVDSDAPRVGLSAGAVLEQRYRVDGLIGCGAMAEVYAATDLRLARRVALKVMSTELVHHPTARRRMEAEAAKLGQVRHPNLIEIHNVFEHRGLLVLDLELATSGTLAARIGRHGMPAPAALHAVEHVLLGLAAIHQFGLVHRDLKPANVLVTAGEVFKIADLGVARDPGMQLTRIGTRIGTPAYMSPEQVRGQRDVDQRSDIYSAGILIYELLTGAVPFASDSEYEVMAAHINVAPDLQLLKDKAPPCVVVAVEKALAKEPGQRWRDADELRHALRRDATVRQRVRVPALPHAKPSATAAFPGLAPQQVAGARGVAGPARPNAGGPGLPSIAGRAAAVWRSPLSGSQITGILVAFAFAIIAAISILSEIFK